MRRTKWGLCPLKPHKHKKRFNFKDKHSRFRTALIMLKKIHVKLCYPKKKKKNKTEMSCLFLGVVRKSPELGFNDV